MKRIFVLSVCLVLFGAFGCGGDSLSKEAPPTEGPADPQTPDASDASDAGGTDASGIDGGLDCSGDLIACDGECVDPKVDVDHCGDCGERCESGELCVEGSCATTPDDCRQEGCSEGHYCDEADGQCKPGCSGPADCPGGHCDMETRTCVCSVGQIGLLPSVEVTGAPRAMTAADFDGDDRVDVVVSGYAHDEVELLVGVGDGTFQPPVSLGVGEYPGDLVHLDLRNDGSPDLIVANSSDSDAQLQLLENDGQAGFLQPTTISTAVALDRLAVADLNGDGLEDLAGLNSYQETLVQLSQQPDGTFESTSFVLSGCRPESLAIADLDADGRPDFVIGGSTFSDECLRVHWGSTAGPMDGPVFDLVGAKHVAAGDIDGDGILDLVGLSTTGRIHLSYGQGNREFSTPVEIRNVGIGGELLVADVTGDGLDDILVSSGRWFDKGGDGLELLVSTATETFDVVRLSAGESPRGMTLADTNSDGAADLIVANYESKTVTALPSDGEGSFESAEILPLIPDYPETERIVVHDVDGDGLDDIVILEENGVAVLRSSDQFGQVLDYPGPIPSNTLAVGDFSGDGLPDLVIGNHQANNIALRRGNPDGTFADIEGLSVGYTAYGLALADLDKDGHLDIVTSRNSDSDIYVGFGDGTGALREVVAIESRVNGQSGIAVGDYDADGYLDLAAAYGSYTRPDAIVLYRGSGSTSFTEEFLTLEDDVAVQALTTVDLDGDGTDELFVSVGKGQSAMDPYLALLAPGAATPVLARQTVSRAPRDVIAADGDGDGMVDLYATSDGRVLRYPGTGQVELGTPEVFSLSGNRLAFGKLDANDVPDLAFLREGSHWVGIAWGRTCDFP